MTNAKRITDPLDPEDCIFGIEEHWLPNVGRGLENFSSRGYATINVIEREAIRQLHQTHPWAPKSPAGHDEESFEHWRQMWNREAWQLRNVFNPGTPEFAAVECIVNAGLLRAAIEAGEAEKAAALSALCLMYGIAAGYMPKMETLAAEYRAARAAELERYRKSAGKGHADYAKAKKFAAHVARQLWAEDETIRIGQVAERVREELIKRREHLPDLDSFPEPQTIRGWIKQAGERGELKIPAAARAGGRPAAGSRQNA